MWWVAGQVNEDAVGQAEVQDGSHASDVIGVGAGAGSLPASPPPFAPCVDTLRGPYPWLSKLPPPEG